jgi:hypothetical protein
MSKLNLFTPTDFVDHTNVFLSDHVFGDQVELARGGTYSHSFSLPFLCSEFLKDLSIIYKQGPEVILTSAHTSILEDTENLVSYITFDLTAEDTLKFKNSLCDIYCQLKFITIEDEVYFSVPQEIPVKRTLYGKGETI